jgi:molybdopterin molybdotransferase
MTAPAKSTLLPVEDALAAILADVAPLPSEPVALQHAAGRTVAADVSAILTQPPFDASAMDGYAVRAADAAVAPCDLRLIAESAAGHPFEGVVGAGEAVRIFTGAAMPKGADAVVIQEDVVRNGARISVREAATLGDNVRPAGGDFSAGDCILTAGHRISPRDLLPRVAILATGDELVPPGKIPSRGQIVSSIPLGLAAMVEAAGGTAQHLGIARDDRAELDARIAVGADADVLVTIGGASVGDHDLIAVALAARGINLAFWKIAMRPGKPLLYGKLGTQQVLGLPGNPVSAMLCAHVFLMPLLAALQGRAPDDRPRLHVTLAEPLPENGPRQHYMRMVLEPGTAEMPLARPTPSQDSSLVRLLAVADALLVRAPGAAPLPAGATVLVERFQG